MIDYRTTNAFALRDWLREVTCEPCYAEYYSGHVKPPLYEPRKYRGLICPICHKKQPHRGE